MNLQLTSNFLLKFDFNSSLLLEYGPSRSVQSAFNEIEKLTNHASKIWIILSHVL